MQHVGLNGGALQKAAAKQQSMLDDGASSSSDEDDDDDDDEEDDSDKDEDTAARKEMSIAYLKKTLTSQPLNGKAESDDDDDDDMEVGPAQAFVASHLMPCIQTYTEVVQVQRSCSAVTQCETSMTPFDTSMLVSVNALLCLRFNMASYLSSRAVCAEAQRLQAL